MLKNLSIIAVIIFISSVCISAQNRFEGYSVIVDAPTNQRSTACAVRYAPSTSQVTVTDLDRATPSNIRACGGQGDNLVQKNANGASFRTNPSTHKWCFEGEDTNYRITYPGDQYTPTITYTWVATDDARTRGFFNIRDFGAAGDGRTDDTIAFKSAMAQIASHGGGTLTIPEGDYLVTSPVTLPSGLVMQGTTGIQSMASTSNLTRKNPTRITLAGTNRALFKIGECTEVVTIRDIEFYGQSNVGTSGIEAAGAYDSAQGLYLDRVTFSNFNRGINAYGLPQTNLNWQFDYIKINECRFIFNRDTGIYVNIRNTDWVIEGSLFINPKHGPGQNGDSMHFERSGAVMIQDTFGGGFAHALGGTFLKVLDSGGLTVIGSQTEAMLKSFEYNEPKNPGAGDYSYPITFVNSVFHDPVIFNARRTFVSLGSFYGGDTFTADERLRVYSTGDRFCYDGYILGCRGAQKKNFDRATVIFMTGQPSEGQVQGHPTFFGTDVEFGAPVQMPTFAANALPQRKANGSMVYCSNCRRNSTPCQQGGSGAPAMMVGGQWSCL